MNKKKSYFVKLAHIEMITQLALKIAWCYIFLAFQASFKWVMLLDSLYTDLYRYQNVRRKNKTN